MKRLIDSVECRKVTDNYLSYFTFDVEDWFSKKDNYALIEDDNIAFAEFKREGTYEVHFCFNSARGRKAIDLSKRFKTHFFDTSPAKTLLGFIEVRNKKARWLIRQVGFESLGFTTTKNGLCEMFYTTKDSDGFLF